MIPLIVLAVLSPLLVLTVVLASDSFRRPKPVMAKPELVELPPPTYPTLMAEIEGTGVSVEVSRCPSNRSWSCPQDIVNAEREGRGIPAHCSVDGCHGRTSFVPFEEWLAKSGEIQPVLFGGDVFWARTPLAEETTWR